MIALLLAACGPPPPTIDAGAVHGADAVDIRMDRPTLPLSSPQLVAGPHHVCQVETDGVLRCWGIVAGEEDWGQTRPPEGRYVDVGPGRYHTCALREDGRARCWGWDAWGETQPPEVPLVTLRSAAHRSCGIDEDLALHCWGKPFAQPLPDGRFTGLALSDTHGCVVDVKGGMHCFGDEAVPAPDGAWIHVAVADGVSCGVRPDKTAACWGDNASGRAQPPSGAFVDVAVGAKHGCGVTEAGSARCWGGELDAGVSGEGWTRVAIQGDLTCVSGPETADCFRAYDSWDSYATPLADGWRPNPEKGQRNTVFGSDKTNRKPPNRWRRHEDLYAQFVVHWPGKVRDEGWGKRSILEVEVDNQVFSSEPLIPDTGTTLLAKLAWYDLTDELNEAQEPDAILDAVAAMHGVTATPGTYHGHPMRTARFENAGEMADWRAILAHGHVYVLVLRAPDHPHFAQTKRRFLEGFVPLDPERYSEAQQAEVADLVAAWEGQEAEKKAKKEKEAQEKEERIARIEAKHRQIAEGERLPDDIAALGLIASEHMPKMHCTMWVEGYVIEKQVPVTFDIVDGAVKQIRFPPQWSFGRNGRDIEDPTGGCLRRTMEQWAFPPDMNTTVTFTLTFW